MFGFIITIAIFWPQPIAEHFNTPPVQEYTVTSNFSFKSEEACNKEAAEFLIYVKGGLPMAKLAAAIDCYAGVAVDL